MLLLALFGLFIGAIGTMVGVGGGFILIPLLLFLHPEESPDTITAISLAVIYFNALSGSIAYARLKRIDYRSGLLFAAAAIPGAIVGAWTTKFLTRAVFDAIAAYFLILISIFLLVKNRPARAPRNQASLVLEMEPRKLGIGVLISSAVGFLSSILGIGGGVIHVPALVYLLGFPVHMATATSQFVLGFTTFFGTASHIWMGSLNGVWPIVFGLAGGVICGAQIGAKLSTRINSVWILRGLSLVLLAAGIRILLK